MNRDDLESIADGYVTAALLADCMPMHLPACPAADGSGACDCESAQELGGLERLEPTAESRAYVVALVAAFAEAAGDDLVTFADLRERTGLDRWASVGHDLRLSSGGHGAGFWDRRTHDGVTSPDLVDAFEAARDRLQALAYDDRRFTRIGGGDVWQLDDDTAEFDPLPFHAGAAPGDRWECPPLTSAQRQAWIETGRVPDVADTYGVDS